MKKRWEPVENIVKLSWIVEDFEQLNSKDFREELQAKEDENESNEEKIQDLLIKSELS